MSATTDVRADLAAAVEQIDAELADVARRRADAERALQTAKITGDVATAREARDLLEDLAVEAAGAQNRLEAARADLKALDIAASSARLVELRAAVTRTVEALEPARAQARGLVEAAEEAAWRARLEYDSARVEHGQLCGREVLI